MLRIPNLLLDFPLSPNALKVYVYLLSCADAERTAIVRVSRIAERCHVCANTVRAAVGELGGLGLLEKQNRYNAEHHYIANAYKLACPGGKWFALDTTNNSFALGGSTFMVYLYLLRCRGRNGKAFPSLRRIERAIGVCRAVVVKAIKQLAALGLLIKAALRPGKHNLYTVLRTLFAKASLSSAKSVKKESAAGMLHSLHKDKMDSRKPICKVIIAPFGALVKRFGRNLCKALQKPRRFLNGAFRYSRRPNAFITGKGGLFFAQQSLDPP